MWERFFEKFVSSHVGSLPLSYSQENFEKCFRDLVNLGLDVVPLPQLRDFVSMYVEPLVEKGLVERSKGFYKASEEDLAEASHVTPVIPELELVYELSSKYGVRWLRVPITGTFTLASKIYLGDPSRGIRASALSSKELVVESLSKYVGNIVRAAIEAGGRVIVIDEPILSSLVGRRVTLFGYSDDEIIEAYESELKRARGLLRGTHVCGRVSEKLISMLCEVDRLEFLSHEFHDTPSNIELPWRRLLEEGDKFLSPGVFSSRSAEVESIGEIASLARKVLKVVGLERVNVFAGDCGLGGLRGVERAYEVSMSKLGNLVRAVELLNKEYGLP